MAHIIPGSGGGEGSVSTSTLLDYLKPEIYRPDIYEERSFVVKDIHGPSSSPKKTTDTGTLLYTIGIIILSAAIFITFVSWTDVLRSWYDSKYINDIIAVQTTSRIYYATTITIIALIISLFLIGLWWYFVYRKSTP